MFYNIRYIYLQLYLTRHNEIVKCIHLGYCIKFSIRNLDLLTQVENEKLRKYDIIAMMYKCRVKIIPYVMTWDGIVTKCHKKYVADISIQPKTEAYIQLFVLRKTFESLSFEKRRGRLERGTRSNKQKVIVIVKLLNEYKHKNNTHKLI